VVARNRDQDHDDHRYTQNVPPHRDSVEERQQAVPEDVHQQSDDEQDDEQRHDDMGVVLHVGRREVEDEVDAEEAAQVLDELGTGVVHGRGHRDEPDQVEPAGEPAPAGAAELRRPVIDAAGRGHRRGELGHREGNRQDQHADQWPADRDGDRTAVVEGRPVGRETAGEHADDRERDREVREGAPAAPQLLLVAEFSEPLLVVAKGHIRHLPPPRGVKVSP